MASPERYIQENYFHTSLHKMLKNWNFTTSVLNNRKIKVATGLMWFKSIITPIQNSEFINYYEVSSPAENKIRITNEPSTIKKSKEMQWCCNFEKVKTV